MNKRFAQFWVYILKCQDGSFYTGYTNDLENRLIKHNSGKGAKYLRGKIPAVLVYKKEYSYFKNAYKAEARIKKLTRKQKEELIRSDKS